MGGGSSFGIDPSMRGKGTDENILFVQWAGELSYLVQTKSIEDLRAFFDRAFWAGRNVTPQWTDVRMALERQDQDIVRLLLTWGAVVSSDDLAALKAAQGADKYARSIELLRRGGFRPDRKLAADFVPAASPAAAPPATGYQDAFQKLPRDWLRVLQSAKDCGATEAVIAGGALRDTCNGAAVKDVDIFLSSCGSSKKNKQFLKKLFKKIHFLVHEQSSGSGYFSSGDMFPDPRLGGFEQVVSNGNAVKVETEAWAVVASRPENGSVTERYEYNFIFFSEDSDRMLLRAPANQSNFGDVVIGLFDTGICQIYTDGRKIGTSSAYRADVANQTITLLAPNKTSVDHLQRLMKKYPAHKLDAKAEEFMKKQLTKRPTPPRSRYSFY